MLCHKIGKFSFALILYEINDFYFSFGPGVRFLHPQFPLHLLFAWKFKTTDGVPSFDTNPFQFVLSFNINSSHILFYHKIKENSITLTEFSNIFNRDHL